MKKKKEWLYVIGWISFLILVIVLFLTPKDNTETKNYQKLTTSNKTYFSTPIYVITHRGANIRTEPSIKSKRYGAVPYGTQLEYYYAQGDWYKVKGYGYDGWVHSSIVSTSEPSSYKSYSKSYYKSYCAENWSCYGDISVNTGRPKTVHVQGYYRKDGTYVRGHYRSKPRR